VINKILAVKFTIYDGKGHALDTINFAQIGCKV